MSHVSEALCLSSPNLPINQFSFIRDRNEFAAFMCTNLSIIILYNKLNVG